jgi:predicted N-acetyltransferase YhbS
MKDIFEPVALSLKNGRRVIVRGIAPGDCCGVSELAVDNFTHAGNFAQLDEAARQAYMQANSIDGVRDASEHRDNIACLVAVEADSGRIVGYRLIRRGLHRLDGQAVAEGKRLHVARSLVGNGLGAALVGISAQIARRCGYARMTAQASGNSRHFFERLGFRCVLEQAHNDVLRQRSIESFIAYLERPL